MSNVLLIVRRELGSYLKRPSGYFIAAAILLLHGLLFNAFAISDQEQLSADVLRIFLYWGGIVTMLGGILFSMRLLAEERWTGTDVLLFTSPIREGEIVLGKYLSALSFLSLVTLASAYLPALIFINGRVSVGHIASGYLGMLLLGASTLAIGTFASSLTKNPFFAVILSALFVGLLELCWPLGQIADPPMRELLSYVALHTKHYAQFQRGLFQLSDVVFYAGVIYLSLLAATKVLESQRWR
ncbi:MAG: ABC transporter permease [Sandaracinaceae bacterium]|nr:ABC transporter permease [Sandaracinaceae bacterium]